MLASTNSMPTSKMWRQLRDCEKIIICENFEDHAKTGGAAFILPDGTEINSLSGFAYWNPSVGGYNIAKAGVGTYHMEI